MLVAPFQCVWLDQAAQQESDYGGVEFEVCGSNDATVIFKRSPGSKRLDTPHNSYCVIFGSNRNRCVRIERQGECQVSVEGGWTKLSSIEFRKFWVYHKGGTFKLGKGSFASVPLLSWTDPDPVNGFLHVGLSSWDCHNMYRGVKTLNWPLFTRETGVATLVDLCSAALMKDTSTLRSCAGARLLSGYDLPGMEPLLENFVFNLASNFDMLVRDHMDWFVKMPSSVVAAILKSPAFCAHWDVALWAVMRWIFLGEDPLTNERMKNQETVLMVLKLIKFHFIDEAVLQDPWICTMSKHIPQWNGIMHDTRILKHDMLTGTNISGKITFNPKDSGKTNRIFSPHTRKSCKELIYVFNGDHNGVSYCLGTGFGKHSWVNPVTLKQLFIRTSSPAGRNTIPKEVVGYKALDSSFASPSVDAGADSSFAWWEIGLGSRKLVCTFYSMRHDGSDGYIRTWNFQGSNDGVGWVDLRTHRDDCTINRVTRWGSWPVHTDKSFSLFRVLNIGPTASTSHPSRFCLERIEVYGLLF